MQSLLGLFYSRIRGSQEDIASEGLAYILQKSLSARQAINSLIKYDCGLILTDLGYVTQNVGANLERPDISGYNEVGKEVLIIEAKFWASFTRSQPVEYLNRLGADSVLLIVCPSLRVRSIFTEIVIRLKQSNLDFQECLKDHSLLFPNNKFLLVKTWNEVLSTVRINLVQNNEQSLISDIDQLIGFCDTIDSNTFLPLQSQDLSPIVPKRINSYYSLIDKVVDELQKKGEANTNGLRATPHRQGYIRYLHLEGFGVAFSLNFDLWARYVDTPFWILFKLKTDLGWVSTDKLKATCKKVASRLDHNTWLDGNRRVYFALVPQLDATEDVVIQNLAEQILELSREIKAGIEGLND